MKPAFALVGADGAAAGCAGHPAPRLEVLLALALIGTRAQGFNHDLASKLQGLVMTLEELSELLEGGGDAEVRRLVGEGLAAASEMIDVLNGYRALTRHGVRAPLRLRELLDRAAARAGVGLDGAIPDVEVDVAAAACVQALALALDVASGQGRGRAVALACRVEAAAVELAMPVVPPAAAPGAAATTAAGRTGELIAVAAGALARDGAELRCSDASVTLRLPRPT